MQMDHAKSLVLIELGRLCIYKFHVGGFWAAKCCLLTHVPHIKSMKYLAIGNAVIDKCLYIYNEHITAV